MSMKLIIEIDYFIPDFMLQATQQNEASSKEMFLSDLLQSFLSVNISYIFGVEMLLCFLI